MQTQSQQLLNDVPITSPQQNVENNVMSETGSINTNNAFRFGDIVETSLPDEPCRFKNLQNNVEDEGIDVCKQQTVNVTSKFEQDVQACLESIVDDKPSEDIVEDNNKGILRRRDFQNGIIPSAANEKNKTFRLLSWKDMPRHLQFNPHIHTGYRPLMTFDECLCSLFYWHNETINIFSHGFAIVYIFAIVPRFLPWSTKGALEYFLSWCHLIGSASPWIGSFFYHLFMNLNYGEKFYKMLLKLDMLGIWLCQSIGAIPMIAAAVHCLSDKFWYFWIFLYCLLSVWGLLKAMHAKSPWERRLCFSPPFMMRMLVLSLRLIGLSGGNPEALHHVILQDLVAVIGGIIGALRIPEKWIPGKVDLMLNSHNLMHIMVVLAVCYMHAATLQDLAWMADPTVCKYTTN